MKNKIEDKIKLLSNEAQSLMEERQSIRNRIQEIDVRTHQIVGAIYELQSLILDPDQEVDQSSEPDLV
jgi:hypothetical protein